MLSIPDRANGLTLGLYGKLPSHGDFLCRRVSEAFLEVWDAWLQESVAASRTTLGERWLELYLTSPVWRFAFAEGVCGPAAVVGLMAPSVDRVGRYFPLTMVAELPQAMTPLAAMRLADPFLTELEQLLLDTLESDPLDFDLFDHKVLRLGHELRPAGAPRVHLDVAQAVALTGDRSQEPWQIPLGAPDHLAAVLEELLGHRLCALYRPLSLWWTQGSTVVEPNCLVLSGLPEPDSFVAMLNGTWRERNWRVLEGAVAVESQPCDTDDTVRYHLSGPEFRSAAASDIGRVRRINQDSFLERPEVGVWAVADGIGGFSKGEVASRMVCDALADLMPEPEFEQTIESARRRLKEVNAHLHAASTRPANAVRSGSTVVAMFTRGWRMAVVWAGDSRLYRWRGGELVQLTRDHTIAEEEGGATRENVNVITRAVGANRTLLLDVRHEEVQPGDRFLLCSDGLSRVVGDTEIREWLREDDIRAAVEALIAATLEAGAPDNVTALIVEALA